MISFSETERKINSEQIDELENQIALVFPNEYRQHLLTYNGGRCFPNVFEFIERGKKTTSNVDWFLALYEGEGDNLREYIEIYKIDNKRLPNHIVPIAHDPGGNLICISCGKKDYGFIYFWDHEREVNYNIANDEDYSNLYLVAESFNSFIENLKVE